jgi:hypothetical protein
MPDRSRRMTAEEPKMSGTTYRAPSSETRRLAFVALGTYYPKVCACLLPTGRVSRWEWGRLAMLNHG